MSTPSIQNRMLITIVGGLLCLVATHLTLEAYFTNTTYRDTQLRLQEFSAAYAQNIEWGQDGNLHLKEGATPDPKFNNPRGNLYAMVLDMDAVVWSTPSVRSIGIPQIPSPDPSKGLKVFSHGDPSKNGNLHLLRSPLLIKNAQNGNEKVFTLVVAEDGTLTDVRVRTFKNALWLALTISFVFILLAQTFAARWSIRPLQNLMQELKGVRAGKQSEIKGIYPAELSGVSSGLNDLINHEGNQTQLYRNSLANVAHSLKTPLAVINSALESGMSEDQLKREVRAQAKRMSDTISYQLSVAARSGRSTFTKPQEIEPVAMELVQSLEKIHQAKKALCEFEIEPHLSYPINKGDLQELLGNLLENAFKWCRRRVLLTVQSNSASQEVVFMVEDDGAGVPEESIHDIIKRGVRADERVQGHGIGLAIVDDILRSYEGVLAIEKSEELGGAKFIITLPLKE